jgi:hypothetical protein
MKSIAQHLLLASLILIFAVPGADLISGQTAKSSVPNIVRTRSFEHGEELVYVAELSRSLLRKIDVAEFRFTSQKEDLPKKAEASSTRAAYSLKLTGDVTSRGFFTRLFNLHFRERIESTVDPASFTVQKTKRLDEHGKRTRISEAIYDHAKGTVSWTERDPNNPNSSPRVVSNPFIGQIQDVLSAIYYLRTQPLEVGKTFEVTISNSGRVHQVPVRVVEKRRLKTVLGRVETFQVDPLVFGEDRLIRGQGQFSIWLVNDSKRIPAKARIKTEYGTFDIKLKKVVHNQTLTSNFPNLP